MMMQGLGYFGVPDFSDSCGASPCGLSDYVYMSDSCLNYIACVDPNNPWVPVSTKGLLIGGTQVAVKSVGQAVGGAVSSAASGVGSGLIGSDGTAATLVGGLSIVGVIAAALVGAIVLAKIMR